MSKHRTAMGKTVDMGSLITRNEKVRAVGNMRVNARGDLLDSNNRVIQDATKRVGDSYNNTVSDAPKIKTMQKQAVSSNINLAELSSAEQEFEQQDEDFKKN
jgi:hypothetical protein